MDPTGDEGTRILTDDALRRTKLETVNTCEGRHAFILGRAQTGIQAIFLR